MACDTLASNVSASPKPSQGARRCSSALAVTLLCSFTYATPSFAHVALDTPKSGLTLAVGSTVVITWEDTILHEGIGYDLDLVGADQQLQSAIVHELPTRLHRYDWRVPDISCVACYVMVTQVNRGQDYNDSALVNIYGKPAAGGSGGTGGSSDVQGGAGRLLAGGSGGSPGQHASGGAAGNFACVSRSEWRSERHSRFAQRQRGHRQQRWQRGRSRFGADGR